MGQTILINKKEPYYGTEQRTDKGTTYPFSYPMEELPGTNGQTTSKTDVECRQGKEPTL